MPDPIQGIPEDRVARILARAAELDRVAPTVQLETIRTAAMEAGISSAAIDKALEEFAAGLQPMPGPAAPSQSPREERFLKRWARRLARPLRYAGMFLVAGMLGGAAEVLLVGAFALFVSMLIREAWQTRRPREIGTYAAVAIASAVALSLGIGIMNGDEDAMVGALVGGMFLLPAGTLFILARHYWKSVRRANDVALPLAP